IYLSELQHQLREACGIEVTEPTIRRALRNRGFTRKHVPIERNEEHRIAFQAHVGENLRADQLVFVDESACNRNTVKRSMAWAPIGSRARRR
ncbi:hypothetical protein BJ138DRAFT_988170, partial [Hygrophoropsis aurantiaca]